MLAFHPVVMSKDLALIVCNVFYEKLQLFTHSIEITEVQKVGLEKWNDVPHFHTVIRPVKCISYGFHVSLS
jgi:hypothetical protein